MKNLFQKYGKPSLLILIISGSLLSLIITFGLFIVKFHDYPISNKPSDWYSFIPIVISIANLSITGIIAWQVQTINKKNSRRNSVLQYLGEIYIDIDNCTNKYLGKVALALNSYEFDDIDIQKIMDLYEDELNKIKPKCIAFYNDSSCNSFSRLLRIVKDFNYQLRVLTNSTAVISYEELFRDPVILDLYVNIDKNYKRTQQFMKYYMNE